MIDQYNTNYLYIYAKGTCEFVYYLLTWLTQDRQVFEPSEYLSQANTNSAHFQINWVTHP